MLWPGVCHQSYPTRPRYTPLSIHQYIRRHTRTRTHVFLDVGRLSSEGPLRSRLLFYWDFKRATPSPPDAIIYFSVRAKSMGLHTGDVRRKPACDGWRPHKCHADVTHTNGGVCLSRCSSFALHVACINTHTQSIHIFPHHRPIQITLDTGSPTHCSDYYYYYYYTHTHTHTFQHVPLRVHRPPVARDARRF